MLDHRQSRRQLSSELAMERWKETLVTCGSVFFIDLSVVFCFYRQTRSGETVVKKVLTTHGQIVDVPSPPLYD